MAKPGLAGTFDEKGMPNENILNVTYVVVF